MSLDPLYHAYDEADSAPAPWQEWALLAVLFVCVTALGCLSVVCL